MTFADKTLNVSINQLIMNSITSKQTKTSKNKLTYK